jgi:hypothetical protein
MFVLMIRSEEWTPLPLVLVHTIVLVVPEGLVIL